MKTFGERMRMIRRTFGSRGDRTSCTVFARELGIIRQTLYIWETRTKEPRITIEQLSAHFARVAEVNRRGVEPRVLAAWAITGEGDSPVGGADSALSLEGSSTAPALKLANAITATLASDANPVAKLAEIETLLSAAKKLGYFITCLAPRTRRLRAVA